MEDNSIVICFCGFLQGGVHPFSLDPRDPSFPPHSRPSSWFLRHSPLEPLWDASWAVIMAPGGPRCQNACCPGPRFQMPFPSQLGTAPHPGTRRQLAACGSLPFLSPNSPFHQHLHYIRSLVLPLIKSASHLPVSATVNSPACVLPAAWGPPLPPLRQL